MSEVYMRGSTTVGGRSQEIYNSRYRALAAKTDRVFAYLFVFQWLLGIAFAFWVSPLTWAGDVSRTHLHVYAAIFLGGLVASFPLYLIVTEPGRSLNRIAVPVAQMLFSVLLIHLSGGRIETHFHIFGSLAFLAFYRDWRTVLIATVITAFDHFMRGALWPESVYGVLSATPWRAVEHAAWVVFEDIILFYSIKLSVAELWAGSQNQANLELKTEALERATEEINELNQTLEHKVAVRTFELHESQQTIVSQQGALETSSKMSALGEMAAGIAHEINNPLSIIKMRVEQMEECVRDGDVTAVDFGKSLKIVNQTVDRISKIVNGLRFFARDGKHAPPLKVKLTQVVDETLSFCKERFQNHGVQLDIIRDEFMVTAELECRSVELSQVLLNLLNNAFDAIEKLPVRWVRLDVQDAGDNLVIRVTDSGSGIPAEIREKLNQPFFTTKEVGKGTGLGLSISRGIVAEHHGKFEIDAHCPNTRFVVTLPKVQPPDQGAADAA